MAQITAFVGRKICVLIWSSFSDNFIALFVDEMRSQDDIRQDVTWNIVCIMWLKMAYKKYFALKWNMWFSNVFSQFLVGLHVTMWRYDIKMTLFKTKMVSVIIGLKDEFIHSFSSIL